MNFCMIQKNSFGRIFMRRHIVPDVVKDQNIQFLKPHDMVLEAAKLFAQYNLGAVLIVEDKKLTGIFTERDLAIRVVAEGKDPSQVKLSEVMTENPTSIKPSETVLNALQLMQQTNCRHLPVLDESDKIVAIVSVRDLYKTVTEQLKEDLAEREAFIFNGSLGGPR